MQVSPPTPPRPAPPSNAPSHPIGNRLLRLTADSHDLLAVIKKEGKV